VRFRAREFSEFDAVGELKGHILHAVDGEIVRHQQRFINFLREEALGANLCHGTSMIYRRCFDGDEVHLQVRQRLSSSRLVNWLAEANALPRPSLTVRSSFPFDIEDFRNGIGEVGTLGIVRHLLQLAQ